MSIGTTAAIIGGISAAGSIASGAIGAHAASSAADKQVAAEQQALDFQKGVYGDQVKNQQPYVDAGQYSIGQLMKQLQNGTFGAGSNPNFTAPTADEARATPGYEFTLSQGMRGVGASQAARGMALSGAGVKEAAGYATGLADTTYNDVFSRALQGYQANLQKQAQEYGQESGVATLGQSAIQSIGNTGTQAATNIGNIMSNIGNAQAAGTVGSANAWSNGISGATNGIVQSLLLNKLGGFGGPSLGPGANLGNLPGGGGIPSLPTPPFIPGRIPG